MALTLVTPKSTLFMLYQCCQDARVIDIPTKLYYTISDNELDRLCTEGNGAQISNPFYGSYAETHGVILTPEQVEEKHEQEYEAEEAVINADLNITPDYWE